LRWYISQGINPNTYDENRTSPLHIAARQGSIQIIKELIISHAGINLTDCAGWTPLHVAAYYGRSTVVNELLMHNADYCLANRRGDTPWDLASNDSTQEVFRRHCRDTESEYFSTKKQIDLSSLELANVIQSMRCDQSTPIIEESSSVINTLSWNLAAHSHQNQIYTQPSYLLKSQCIKVFNTEPLKGFSFFVSLGCVAANPKDIAKFLLDCNKINKSALGIVLGENSCLHKDIAIEFMKLIDLTGLNIVAGLRKVMDKCKFPTEGSRLDNLLQAFAIVYSKENIQFGGPDAVQGLSFSILMIEIEKLKKKDFFNSAKGLIEEKDYPAEVLSRIYDEITKNPLGYIKESQVPETFNDFVMEGNVLMHKKLLNIGLVDDILLFLSQDNRSPYAIAILRDCEVSDSWLQGSVVIKSNKGIITAKFTKEGRVIIKKEPMLVFKSDDWRKWMEVLKKVTDNYN
jgi:Sec7 domain/Ankyrin repeats (3 copies)